ncbi:hypothetical protein CNMCM8980_009133 [Aspergillus fumigatiaffinis]|uniref:Bromo domain-containing protein n=1 Tax=Aspergillus fumigatiaffinis TaxID=340414 RepID=A0A8H4GX86_9EURO|nr:hypothetical protein CNMCM5878_001212 [Aspergillus fumigatiaffinis]KAF4223043.1 hypothetical protein CNMCM6457_000810 [Aspergillus fumigatiaffinis]KAF4230150.1 hypothetical protein CNMCM6805_000971 [Aspergillus fumigatiaffinis]KAF4246013.1 hypothetical protein CNMCM8980_009133 [Aspergillus fumigatiaffinis]
MPPLSAYTPFESLLFFQSLATLGTRPINFASISDILRNNTFVRENVAFNADRLSPEALEELYTTLMREGLDGAGAVSLPEQNGVHPEGAQPTNPLKRKIASPRPEVLVDKGRSHASFLPELVSHLYARYKELATREIRNEERRYKEISDEIERLQKEERQKPSQPAPAPTSVQASTVRGPQAKQDFAPEPMDLDVKEERPAQQLRQEPSQPAVQPPLDSKIKQIEQESQRKDIVPSPPQEELAQPTAPSTAAAAIQQPQVLSTQPPAQPHQEQLRVQQQPLPQPQPADGQAPSTVQHAPANVPSIVSSAQKAKNGPAVHSQQPAAAPSPGNLPTFTAAPLQAQHDVQKPTPVPAPSPAPAARPAGKKGASAATSVSAPQPPTPQPIIQQWSLHRPPQTPQPPPFTYPQQQADKRAMVGRPPANPLQHTPKPEPEKPFQATPRTPVPSTPGPPSAPIISTAVNGHARGYQTPVGAAQGLFSEAQNVHRPQLSVDTRSSTPWKKTPRLSIPLSPRSPIRPRPEDVSPISERAPSPIEFSEPLPEETGGRRNKRRAVEEKGARAIQEPSLPQDVEPKGRLKPKVEKATGSAAGKKRDRSTTSSRSRGRSVVSRDEESVAEAGNGPIGKIKHELPGTPANIPEPSELEGRASGARKGAAALPQTEERPGRGRPKRKRGISDAPEPEPVPTEPIRPESTQSASFVLCPRNFPRTGAPIMNDVTMHKHASIFAKPLAERDAPGYRDLIYRPQDLKSIKSSIHQGSRAVAAATEAASTPAADGESPAPNAGTTSKNAVLVLPKTEDVIPPKAIVNSAQLEKELIRMFANAVMFNPIPQRGFGPGFPMMSDTGSRESTQVPEPDEGGIIKDTLEMFEDVEQAVTRWRAAERTADELASKSILSLRRGSTSDLNTDSADEVKGP